MSGSTIKQKYQRIYRRSGEACAVGLEFESPIERIYWEFALQVKKMEVAKYFHRRARLRFEGS